MEPYQLLLLFISGFAAGIVSVISLQKEYNLKSAFGFKEVKFRIKRLFNKKEDAKR